MLLKFIPNLITLVNALMGACAVFCIFSHQLDYLPLFLGIGFVADFSDGFVARLLKANSAIGKELDSLADMISFGVVPGAMLVYLLQKAGGVPSIQLNDLSSIWPLSGFVFTLFAAYRLAKFNVDERQTDSFIGLNTPAATIFILGLLLMVEQNSYQLASFLLQIPLLIGLTLCLSILLVAEIPMMSFKFKSFGWKGNQARFILMLGVICFLLFLEIGLAAVLSICLYLLFSFISNAMEKQ